MTKGGAQDDTFLVILSEAKKLPSHSTASQEILRLRSG